MSRRRRRKMNRRRKMSRCRKMNHRRRHILPRPRRCYRPRPETCHSCPVSVKLSIRSVSVPVCLYTLDAPSFLAWPLIPLTVQLEWNGGQGKMWYFLTRVYPPLSLSFPLK